MFKLALRNVFRQKLRTAIALAAIIFGGVALILSGGFIQDVYHELGEALIHSQSGHLQISRPGFHAHGRRSPEKYVIDETAPLRDALLRQPEVDDVMGRLNFSGVINNGRSDWPVVGEGVEPDKESRLGTHVRILRGRQLRNDDAYGVLLGEGAATAMKLVPGDRVTLLANTLAGAINTADFEVVGIFQSFSKDYDARAVRITLDAAHGLLSTAGINTLVISLKQTEYTRRVADAVERQIDRRELEVNTWQQLNDFYQSTVALYERQFGVLQLIILILVLLSVANSVNMSVFERVGEFGTMMALGNPSGTVFRLVLTENAVLGASGALLGVATGMILAQIISAIGVPMPPPPNANVGYTAHIRISASMLLTTFAITSCATVLAALIPARRVSRIRVAAALSQNY